MWWVEFATILITEAYSARGVMGFSPGGWFALKAGREKWGGFKDPVVENGVGEGDKGSLKTVITDEAYSVKLYEFGSIINQNHQPCLSEEELTYLGQKTLLQQPTPLRRRNTNLLALVDFFLKFKRSAVMLMD